MSVVKFPGKDEPKDETQKLYFVCRCGCTTFVLRPGYIIECANCKLIHTSGDMAAWQLDEEPPVPPVLAEDIGRKKVVVDFHEGNLSMERVKRRLDYKTSAFVIHATLEGDVHTWGNISGRAQNEWLARQLQTAINLLTDADSVEVIDEADAAALAAAKKVADRVLDDEPNILDWLDQNATKES